MKLVAPPPTEQEVRALRDRVYGTTGDKSRDDKNWSNCRDNWMRPDSVAFLQKQAAREMRIGGNPS